MKKVNYLFLLFAAIFSAGILFISLQSANKNEATKDSSMKTGKFYVAKEILPDHSLYPLLMIVDRMRLELSDSERRTYLLVAYGNRRLFYSNKLLEKGNLDLALITLSKANKYINQALEENIVLLEKSSINKQHEYQALAFFVLENLDKHINFNRDHRSQFVGEQQSVVDSFSLESLSSADKLRRLMNQSN